MSIKSLDIFPASLKGFTPLPDTLYLHDQAESLVSWSDHSPHPLPVAVLTARPPLNLNLNVQAWLSHPEMHLPLSFSVQLSQVVYGQRAVQIPERDHQLGELLEEGFAERLPMPTVLERATQYGADLSRVTQVMLLRLPSRAPDIAPLTGRAPNREAVLREVHRAAANAPARVLVCQIAGHVALLFNQHAVAADVLGAQVAHHLAQAFPQAVLTLAAGSEVSGPLELPRSYREAVAALDASTDLPRLQRFVQYADVRHLLIYREIRQNAALVELLESTLRPLTTLEGEYRRHMLETLISYLEHGRSPARAAAALGVHPNTMKYRMKRIAELINLERVSGQQDALYYLAAQMALHKSRR